MSCGSKERECRSRGLGVPRAVFTTHRVFWLPLASITYRRASSTSQKLFGDYVKVQLFNIGCMDFSCAIIESVDISAHRERDLFFASRISALVQVGSVSSHVAVYKRTRGNIFPP